MPFPKPTDSETESQFVSRCISKLYDEYETSQAAAICYKTYRENMSSQKEIFVLTPRKKENRGMYISRCSRHKKVKEQYKDVKERLNFCMTSFNEFYKYWAKIEMSKVPSDTILGNCITKKKAQGLDYKEAYARCASKVVVPNTPVVLGEDNLIIEPVSFGEMNILGYQTKYFDLCPGAQNTFKHLISMNPDEETMGMIRSAAQVADNVFEIEKMVIDKGEATLEDVNQATILVDDFYDIMEEIDEELNMLHDVTYMDGHIEKIESYLKKSFATIGPRGGIKESKKAPKSDTPNPDPKGEGSAKGDASGKRGASVTSEQEKTLEQKVKDFNEKESNTKNGNATLGSLKSVFQRGLGAYNTSHSPNVKSAEQWAYARVNAYLYLLKNGRPENPKYTTDYDLLPKGHPKNA